MLLSPCIHQWIPNYSRQGRQNGYVNINKSSVCVCSESLCVLTLYCIQGMVLATQNCLLGSRNSRQVESRPVCPPSSWSYDQNPRYNHHINHTKVTMISFISKYA
jgi:hypothetical protein